MLCGVAGVKWFIGVDLGFGARRGVRSLGVYLLLISGGVDYRLLFFFGFFGFCRYTDIFFICLNFKLFNRI